MEITPEMKSQAKTVLKDFFANTTEVVLTKALHAFSQADGLVMCYDGARRICYILNGVIYTCEPFVVGNKPRDQNAFIQADFDLIRTTFKVQGPELHEDEFYIQYLLHSEKFAEQKLQQYEAMFHPEEKKEEPVDNEKDIENNNPESIVPPVIPPPPAVQIPADKKTDHKSGKRKLFHYPMQERKRDGNVSADIKTDVTVGRERKSQPPLRKKVAARKPSQKQTKKSKKK